MIRIVLINFMLCAVMGCSRCNNSSDAGSTGGGKVAVDSVTGDAPAPSSVSEAMEGMMETMSNTELTGNVDADFAMMMSRHHKGAIDMAEVELASGSSAELKAIAQRIATVQKSEEQELLRYVELHKDGPKNYDPEDRARGFGKVLDKNMQMMAEMQPSGASVDKHCVDMMIPHYETAVYMTEGYLQYGKDPQLKDLARKMIADQSKEIEEFRNWKDRK